MVFAFTDANWKKITQTAYDAQKKAGTDVSVYKPIGAEVVTTPQPSLDTFWDVNQKTIKPVNTWTGVNLSNWVNVPDVSKVDVPKPSQNYDVFGKEAQILEQQTPWFLNKRNDAYAMDILKNNPNLTQDNADKIILDYIASRDKNSQLNTGDRGDVDVQNTIQSIKSRIGSIPTDMELQQKTLTNRATSAYDRAQTDIQSQYDAEKNAFTKAWGVEDKYTNFNEVNTNIDKVLLEAGKNRQENMYTGMPTDEQINQIAQKTWNTFEITKKILEGRWFEDLQMQDSFKNESEQPYTRVLSDLELQKTRAIQDAENSHMKTMTTLNEQIDDVKKQMTRSVAIWEKSWALSGAVKSSWYMMWLDNIIKDATQNVDRLKLRQDRDTQDTAQLKQRITEDYTQWITRTKEDLEKAMNQIKTSNGAALSQYINEYAPSSSELTRKLNALSDKFGNESQQAFNTYLWNLRGITDTMTYDTEKMLNLQQLKQNLQQTSVTNLLKDNGAALAGISMNQLSTMLQNWDISSSDYVTMSWYMKSLGMQTLQSLWVPTQEDFALYNQMIDQWSTPSDAIASITSRSPGRFTTTNNKEFQKWFTTPTQWPQPSWNLTPVQLWAKEVVLDSSVTESISTAFKDMQAAWLDVVVVWQWHRDQVATIKTMAAKWWIPFNEANPAETAALLTAAWHKVAAPWLSKHETWMAVDLYAADWKSALDAKHVKYLNDNWWFQTAWAWDMWHFEYTWKWNWGWNSSQKETYLALVKKWWLTKNDQTEIANLAVKQWRSDEFNEALKQGAVIDMSPAQIAQYNKEYDRFKWNQVVKWFEEWLTQYESLAYSLWDKSGPGDMAGVFSFMKTLDPTSVVRETEFESAANSAGLLARAKNIYSKLTNGKILTPEQAEDFKRIAKEFIKSRASSYDRLYWDLDNAYAQFGIDKSLLPSKASNQLLNFINKQETSSWTGRWL